MLFGIGLLIVGHKVIINGIRNLCKGGFLDENFLMTIATVAALCINYYTESVAVMVFFCLKNSEFFSFWG